MSSYRDEFRRAERDTYWTLPRVFFWIGLVIVAILFFRIVMFPIWFASRTVDVIQQQIDPAEILRKYELFKDESAQLDAKLASIKIKQKQIKDMKGMPLDRTNREQLMIWQQELGGMQYSYNSLAADYNAQMAKINYRFANRGDLPQGATQPLPREYKPYEEE